jgi:tetratricopeptide (TPR) repeat protein
VHEQIQPAVEASGGTVRPTAIHIEHSGYDDPAVYRRKLERNIRLLLLEDQECPNDPFTLMNLGWAHKDVGQVAVALAYYRRALERCNPEASIVPKLHALIVRGHLALGQRQEAMTACRAGRNHRPGDTELSFLEAVLLSEQGDLPAAEALFMRLLENRPEDPLAVASNPGMRGHMARHNLARVYRAQGRAAEAEAQWKAALAERPQSVRSLFELGLLYLAHNRLVEAERVVQQLTTLGSVGELAATMLRAETYVRQNDVAAARRLLETSIATGPPALEPRVRLSRLLLEHGADRDATENALRSVLALDPNHAEAGQQLRSIISRDERGSLR